MKKYFLTTTIVLLALFANAAAQNRATGETLVGLRDIALSVEYAQADGLEASKRPVILQQLQARAIEQLTKAEIPLRKATNGSDAAGGPRLVFTVTANKDAQTAPAIYVETKIYERVHLFRDATKEMNLPTWVYDGTGGPRVFEKLLFDVFDGQVKYFIKAYREVNPDLKPGEGDGASSMAPLESNADSLQGLMGISVYVAFRRGLKADPPERVALRAALQQEAEAKLVKSGVPVPKGNDIEPQGHPLLYLFITLSEPMFERHAIEVESRFWQQVRPSRDLQKEIRAVTWESFGSGEPPITDAAVRGVLNQQLDEFIKAYTAANPKQAVKP